MEREEGSDANSWKGRGARGQRKRFELDAKQTIFVLLREGNLRDLRLRSTNLTGRYLEELRPDEAEDDLSRELPRRSRRGNER